MIISTHPLRLYPIEGPLFSRDGKRIPSEKRAVTRVRVCLAPGEANIGWQIMHSVTCFSMREQPSCPVVQYLSRAIKQTFEEALRTLQFQSTQNLLSV